MWDNIDDVGWDKCRKNWAELDDNTGNICRIIEEHKTATNDTVILLEEGLKKFENMKALSALSFYKNFISDFFEEVEARLGANVWAKVRAAINRKLRNRKVDFKRDEEEYISKLRNFLQEINMTVEDIELMMILKKKNNAEFHKRERLEPKELKEKFETLFPEDLKDFKDSMRKVFDALDNWDRNY
ncbi:hypothetical protein RhiirA4_409660, partial [Rhizophagus irregularis]